MCVECVFYTNAANNVDFNFMQPSAVIKRLVIMNNEQEIPLTQQ